MTPYVVKQGDYLTQLAHDLGFDKDAVWNDEKNAELKAKRPNPDILYPGDILYVPDKPPEPSPMAQGTSNGYSADVPTVKVTLVLGGEQPLANQPCEVDGLPSTSSGSTDGNGEIAFDVPVNVREFTITFTQVEYAYRVLVANIDPATEESGIRTRLWNLGFYRRAADPEDADAFSAAVSAFQQQHNLPVTGAVDDATREAIASEHSI
jgi:hypothetical protein